MPVQVESCYALDELLFEIYIYYRIEPRRPRHDAHVLLRLSTSPAVVDIQEDMNLHEDDFERDRMHHYTGTDTGDETITG
eukprot:CAMPEP_0178998170 /NCGR_PEP_ID=MMETSP0795-20121207/9376_1 /TAXON_ID=88552 /ORGANISM="Amoebophrya sp., Strain Ameob2" /LENGTH=79 /DNA_ID=CAMNT_0020690843 /DNA_START=1307 /DNA_END=1546 /DNA_ORIENTATION=+